MDLVFSSNTSKAENKEVCVTVGLTEYFYC